MLIVVEPVFVLGYLPKALEATNSASHLRSSFYVCMYVCMYQSCLGMQLFRTLHAKVRARAPVASCICERLSL